MQVLFSRGVNTFNLEHIMIQILNEVTSCQLCPVTLTFRSVRCLTGDIEKVDASWREESCVWFESVFCHFCPECFEIYCKRHTGKWKFFVFFFFAKILAKPRKTEQWYVSLTASSNEPKSNADCQRLISQVSVRCLAPAGQLSAPVSWLRSVWHWIRRCVTRCIVPGVTSASVRLAATTTINSRSQLLSVVTKRSYGIKSKTSRTAEVGEAAEQNSSQKSDMITTADLEIQTKS